MIYTVSSCQYQSLQTKYVTLNSGTSLKSSQSHKYVLAFATIVVSVVWFLFSHMIYL